MNSIIILLVLVLLAQNFDSNVGLSLTRSVFRKLTSRLNAIRRKRKDEDEGFDFVDYAEKFFKGESTSEANDDVDHSDEQQRNPMLEYVKTLYDSIFFYGLDVKSSAPLDRRQKSQIMSSSGFKMFKRRSLGSPFFTSSELLSLYLIEQKKKGDESQSSGGGGDAKPFAGNSKPFPLGGEKPLSLAQLLQRKKRIEQQISVLQEELKVIEVSLVAAAEDNDTENVNMLKQSETNLVAAIEQAKVKLITIEAELLEE